MQIKISQDKFFHHKIGKNPKFDNTFCCQGYGKQALLHIAGGSAHFYNPDGGNLAIAIKIPNVFALRLSNSVLAVTLQIDVHIYKMA